MAGAKYDKLLQKIRESDSPGTGPGGPFVLKTNNTNDVTDPTGPQDVATKSYVDNLAFKTQGSFSITPSLTAEYPKAVAGTAVNATQTGDGSGAGPAIQQGDRRYNVVDGVIGPSAIAIKAGDIIEAKVDNATNVDADWLIIDASPDVFADSTTIKVTDTVSGITHTQKNTYTPNDYPAVVVSEVDNTKFRIRPQIFPANIYSDDGVTTELTNGVTFPDATGVIPDGENMMVTFTISGGSLMAYASASSATFSFTNPTIPSTDFEIETVVLQNLTGSPFTLGTDNLNLLGKESLKKVSFDMPLGVSLSLAEVQNYITNGLLVTGQQYTVFDRFEYTAMALSPTLLATDGYMRIPASTTPSNLSDEVISIEYDVITDTFANLQDQNGNKIVGQNIKASGFPFANLTIVLTNMQLGTPTYYGNEYSVVTTLATTSAGAIIANNKFRGSGTVTGIAGQTMQNNTFDYGSTYNLTECTVAGTHVGDNSSLNAVAGTTVTNGIVVNGGALTVGAGGTSTRDTVDGGTINVSGGTTAFCTSGGTSTINVQSGSLTNCTAFGGCLITKPSGTGIVDNVHMRGTGTFDHQSDINTSGVYLDGENFIVVSVGATLDKAYFYDSTTTLGDTSQITQGAIIDNCDITGEDDGIIQGGYYSYQNSVKIGLGTVLSSCEIGYANITGMFNTTGISAASKRLSAGFSNFSVTVDLDSFVGYTGTTLDFSTIRHFGEIIFTGANPSYSIDVFQNFNENHDVMYEPASTLDLTIVTGVGAGNPRCEAGTNTVLYGATGDMAKFQYRSDQGEVFELYSSNY